MHADNGGFLENQQNLESQAVPPQPLATLTAKHQQQREWGNHCTLSDQGLLKHILEVLVPTGNQQMSVPGTSRYLGDGEFSLHPDGILKKPFPETYNEKQECPHWINGSAYS